MCNPTVQEVQSVNVTLAKRDRLGNPVEQFIERPVQCIGLLIQPTRCFDLVYGGRLYVSGKERLQQVRIRIEDAQ